MRRDPTRFLAAARRDLGDRSVVDAFGFRLFCVFSAAGVRRLSALGTSATWSGPSTSSSALGDAGTHEPRLRAPAVRRRQIGGVAPAERPLRVRSRAGT